MNKLAALWKITGPTAWLLTTLKIAQIQKYFHSVIFDEFVGMIVLVKNFSFFSTLIFVPKIVSTVRWKIVKFEFSSQTWARILALKRRWRAVSAKYALSTAVREGCFRLMDRANYFTIRKNTCRLLSLRVGRAFFDVITSRSPFFEKSKEQDRVQQIRW